MNARHGALIFHLQSRPRTHLFLVTEKHCHAPCPCSAALPRAGTITRDNLADCGREQWGKERSGLQGRAARPWVWEEAWLLAGPSHHWRMLWAPLAWSRGRSEEGQCLSKLCPEQSSGQHLPSREWAQGPGTENGTDQGHAEHWRGAGTEEGTKVQGKKEPGEPQAEDYLLHLIEIPMQVPF